MSSGAVTGVPDPAAPSAPADPAAATPAQARAVRVLDFGPEAALLEVETQEHVEELYACLESARVDGRLTGVVNLVPAARTVLVQGVDAAARSRAVSVAREWTPGAGVAHGGSTHRIEVVYDGPDLQEVARATGLGVEEVIAVHAGVRYRVAFLGFSPGFGYLTGLPEVLHLPRRADPRPVVPSRSLAVAGEFCAVYPRSSPGGWNLLGRAVDPVWDESWERPALLAPGDTVHFVPVRGGVR